MSNEDYEVIDAEENTDMVEKYGIMQAPTLVVVENGEVRKYVNASNIKKYAESNSPVSRQPLC